MFEKFDSSHLQKELIWDFARIYGIFWDDRGLVSYNEGFLGTKFNLFHAVERSGGRTLMRFPALDGSGSHQIRAPLPYEKTRR